MLLRLVPMACGAALIELCHRAGRLCFPADPWRQPVATLVGGCMPITLCQCQVVHNEPLAAVLAAATFLGCLHLLADSGDSRRRWFAFTLGAAWGLAMLTKSTPLPLSPFLLFALVCQGVSRRESWPRIAPRAGVVPAIGLVAASGAGSFLDQPRWRALLLACLTTWAAAGFIAFACLAG